MDQNTHNSDKFINHLSFEANVETVLFFQDAEAHHLDFD